MGFLCDDCGGSALLLKVLLGVIYGGAVLAAVAGVLAALTRFRRRSWPSRLRWWLGLAFIGQLVSAILCGALLTVLGLWRPLELGLHYPWSLWIIGLFFTSLAALVAWVYVERRVPPPLERWRWIDKQWKVALAIASLLLGVGAVRELKAPPFEPDSTLNLPVAKGATEVQARFFGVSTLLISDGKTSLLIDGFFTRPSWLQLALGDVVADKDRIDDALKAGGITRVDAVLVAHSHHDHALDSAVVAKSTGACVVGSSSTANIARGQKLDENRIDVVKNGDSRNYGEFHVTFYETPHSPDPIAPGAICKPIRTPARLCDFQLGAAYSFLVTHKKRHILIVPGANYVPGLFKHLQADVVLLSVGGLGKLPMTFARRYWNETVRATHAKLVVPIHWDDFGRPYERRHPEHLQGSPPVFDDVEKAICRIRSFAETDGVGIGLMPTYQPVALLDIAATVPARGHCPPAS